MAISRCRKAELTIRRGNVRQGVDDLRAGLKPIHAARHELLTTEFNMELALGLLALGQAQTGLNIVNETIDRVEGSGELFQIPELLRIKGALLCSTQSIHDEAERCFREALTLARKQGSGSFELRTATNLAALLADRGRRKEAEETLQPVYGRFTEGFDTADLQAAAELMRALG
jgi:predicted ATPase